MRTLIKLIPRMWALGGWAPLAIFAIHFFLSRGLDAYTVWPQTDIPMHFAGAVAMAFFLSRCFQALPRDAVRSSRMVVLELVLVGSLTATAAVFWEFAEFTVDQLFATNVQVSLANTMKDLALGVAGAGAFILIRARQLRAGGREIREVASEWVGGGAA